MDSRPPEDDATAKLRADFKAWKDREIKRIFCCDWATPEDFEAMWIHMNQQEMIFERSLARGTAATGTKKGNQPQDSGKQAAGASQGKVSEEPYTIIPQFIKPRA